MEDLCDMFRCEIPYTAKKYCISPYEGKCEENCKLGGPDCRRCLNERADICAKCVRSEDNRERVEE